MFSCFSKKKANFSKTNIVLQDQNSEVIKHSLPQVRKKDNSTEIMTHTSPRKQILKIKFANIHHEQQQSIEEQFISLSGQSSQTIPYSVKKSRPQQDTIKFSRQGKQEEQQKMNETQNLSQQENNNNKKTQNQSDSELYKANGILDIDQSILENQEEVLQRIKQINQQQFQKMGQQLHKIEEFQSQNPISMKLSKPKEMLFTFKNPNQEKEVQYIQNIQKFKSSVQDKFSRNQLQEEQLMKQSIFTFQPTQISKQKDLIDQNQKTLIMQIVQEQISSPLNVFLQTRTLDSFQRSSYQKPLSDFIQQEEFLSQTFEQAQNSFFCSNINQEYSRAVINKKYSLALQIFKKMVSSQRVKKDFKGYYPAYISVLATLNNLQNQEAFQFTKQIIYHQDVDVTQKGPNGWTPLQQAIYHKHIRLTPHLFLSSYKTKNKKIRSSFDQMSVFLASQQNFSLILDVKVDSFIPFVGSLTPNDTITITKFDKILLIQFTLVGYEFLICKRRDMACYFDGQSKCFYGLNRSKGIYADLLQELDKEQIQAIVVDILSSQTKKMNPIVNKIQVKKSKSIFDNDIMQQINDMPSAKHIFSINYTSTTEKRRPTQKDQQSQQKSLQDQLSFLKSWEIYKNYEHKIKIKQKNRNKKVQLDMWLYPNFGLKLNVLIKVFALFSMSNNIAKIIYNFLQENTQNIQEFQENFPVKIDIPINFSLYFNLSFRKVNKSPQKENMKLLQDLTKVTRKQYQNLLQSRQKRAFIISAFT